MKFLLLLLITSCLSAFAEGDKKESIEERRAWWSQINQQTLELDKRYLGKLIDQKDNIIGLEIMVAERGGGAGIFGHSLLRFVDNDSDLSNDLVLSAVAETDLPEASTVKGVFGEYGISLNIRPLGDFWIEYVPAQSRAINRYIVSSNAEIRENIINVLDRWIMTEDGAGEVGKYKFFTNNCASIIYKLLTEAGYAKTSIGPKVPLNFDKWLYKSRNTIYPELKISSNSKLIERLSKVLNAKSEDLMRGRNWPANSLELIQNVNFSDLEIKKILMMIPRIPSKFYSTMVKAHNYRNGGATLEEVMDFVAVPAGLYEICTDDKCASDNYQIARTIWTDIELESGPKE